jgi:hypothetical protein
MHVAVAKSSDKAGARTSRSEPSAARHPVAQLQRAAGNHAVQRAMSGVPLPRELRSSLESYFRTPLDRVRIHTDGTSQAMADALGARAFTVGQNIHLGTVATGSERNELLAHEVVHTLQQGQVGPRAKLKVGAPDDHYEKQADRISAAFARGDHAEAVDHIGAPAIQRAMHPTHYGNFEDFRYDFLTDNSGTNVGVEMYMKFHPGTNTRSDAIGLTQVAMGTISGTTDTGGIRGLHQATSGAGVGRFVDRIPGFPNPVYPTTQTVNPGGSATSLADYATRGITALTPAQQALGPIRGRHYTGWGRNGFRKVVSGAFVTQTAELYDVPSFGQAIPNSGQVFETAALALEGPQQGTYYGSVEWGWRTDPAGTMTTVPFRVVSEGVPSVNFLTAATIWNSSRVDLAFETTVATNLLSSASLAALTTVPIHTQVTPTGRQGVRGGTTYIEVTHGVYTGVIDNAALRPVAVGAETLDLPVPMVHTVTNPLGSTMVLSTAATALAPNTLTLPVGTRITTTRCMVPTATLTNHYEGTIVDGPLIGTHGYFFVPDLTLERVGTR